MLAELAAANAAFQVIKAALNNGKELSALGGRVFDYFDNKAKIQEKATKKLPVAAHGPTWKSSWPWSSSMPKRSSCVSA